MTTDELPWKHSRALLRPSLTSPRSFNLPALETHLRKLLLLLPVDGSTVDLKPLFSQLGFDVTTELIFGASSGCLDPGNIWAKDLQESYNTAQPEIFNRMMRPPIEIYPQIGKF